METGSINSPSPSPVLSSIHSLAPTVTDMKFARYLHDTQTPEWKKAYIDYRGLKKCIGAIRAEQISKQSSTGTTDVDHVHRHTTEHEAHIHSASHTDDPIQGTTSGAASGIPMQRRSRRVPSLAAALHGIPALHHLTDLATHAPSQEHSFPPKTLPALYALIPLLPPLHAKFFELLDSELEKIDSFYANREKEMQSRGELLKEQLCELGLHRQKYYESNANTRQPSWPARAHRSLRAAFLALYHDNRHVDADKSNNQPVLEASESVQAGLSEIVNGDASNSVNKSQLPVGTESEPTKRSFPPTKATGNVPPRNSGSPSLKDELSPQEYQNAKKRLRKAVVEHYRGLEVLNNYRILNLTGFRKALKKYGKVTKVSAQAAYIKERVEPLAFSSGAMVNSMLSEMEELFAARFEHGDKKKAISRLRIGTHQKSHHFSTFRTGMWLGLSIPATVTGLILCLHTNTHVSLPAWNILLFIYSILLIPTLLALLVGLNLIVWARERINYVFVFEFNVRSRLDYREYFELPAFLLCALAYCFMLSFLQLGNPLVWPLVWLGLVHIIMFNPIPNFLWARPRWWLIKSIAKLGSSGFRTVEFTDFWLGDQFCSLVYSFSNLYFIGCIYTRYFPNVPSPTTSPSTILSLASLEVFPRYFSSNVVGRDVGGPLPVVLSSAHDPAIQQAWITCGTEQNWGPYFALATIPFMTRFLQSLRRYWDSKLPTHLINAGKYAMGMVNYLCYFLWRRDGHVDNSDTFILWCLSAIVYALYGCAWDFLMDWSICKPHAKYPLLRRELVYTSQIPLYYFAMFANFAIRFIWIFYIPSFATSIVLRSFIAGLLEMLRRVVWNFYRLENEHLGNMDQYRVTREVPLPYSFGNPQPNEDDDDDEDENENENADRVASRDILR